jgi:hypothetical protein
MAGAIIKVILLNRTPREVKRHRKCQQLQPLRWTFNEVGSFGQHGGLIFRLSSSTRVLNKNKRWHKAICFKKRLLNSLFGYFMWFGEDVQIQSEESVFEVRAWAREFVILILDKSFNFLHKNCSSFLALIPWRFWLIVYLYYVMRRLGRKYVYIAHSNLILCVCTVVV